MFAHTFTVMDALELDELARKAFPGKQYNSENTSNLSRGIYYRVIVNRSEIEDDPLATAAIELILKQPAFTEVKLHYRTVMKFLCAKGFIVPGDYLIIVGW